MTEKKQFGSLLEAIEADPIQARELAAARVEMEALAVMHKALKASWESTSSIAEILGTTEEKIAEILEGSRPFSLPFVGRFVKACGFQAHVTFGDSD